MQKNYQELQNFFDPVLTSDGKPFSQERYRQLVKERYIISKHTNTSYLDSGQLCPIERTLLTKYILEELEAQKKIIEDLHAK